MRLKWEFVALAVVILSSLIVLVLLFGKPQIEGTSGEQPIVVTLRMDQVATVALSGRPLVPCTMNGRSTGDQPCTSWRLEDFDQANWDQRAQWTAAMAQTDRERGVWLNNIRGMLNYFGHDSPVFERSPGMSLADAIVLMAIEDGWRRADNDPPILLSEDAKYLEATKNWAMFFQQVDQHQEAAALETWATAEQAGVNYGVSVARALRPSASVREDILFDVFLAVGNAYRTSVRSGGVDRVTLQPDQPFGLQYNVRLSPGLAQPDFFPDLHYYPPYDEFGVGRLAFRFEALFVTPLLVISKPIIYSVVAVCAVIVFAGFVVGFFGRPSRGLAARLLSAWMLLAVVVVLVCSAGGIWLEPNYRREWGIGLGEAGSTLGRVWGLVAIFTAIVVAPCWLWLRRKQRSDSDAGRSYERDSKSHAE